MNKGKLLLVDNEEEELQVLGFGFRKLGYAVVSAGSVPAAELIAKEGGISVVVCDIRMTNGNDHSGLLVVKMVQQLCPKALIIVCSHVARRFEKIARALGAHEVIAKKHDLSRTVLEIDNHILRYSSLREPFSDDARYILAFAGTWFVAPLTAGFAAAGVFLRLGWQIPFSSKYGAAILPIALCAIFILTASDAKGLKDPLVNEWPVFVAFHRFKAWLLGLTIAGIAFEVLKAIILLF